MTRYAQPYRLAGDAAPAAPQPGDIDANGRLVGVDGILDQVGDALRRQVEPMVRDTILPYVSRDQNLQLTIGHAAGDALARRLQPWVILAAGSLAVLAVASVVRARRSRSSRERRHRE